MHSLATRFRGDGLIVHQFDGLKQQRAPWAPCPQDAGRCRCEAASNVTLEKMCAGAEQSPSTRGMSAHIAVCERVEPQF